MKYKRTLWFYIVLFICKAGTILLNMIKSDATYFPGKVAVTLCPDFLGMIEKPDIIIGVTGTNGKTTVTNIITDILIDNKVDVLDNRQGGNINAGIATALIKNTTLFGKNKKEVAVFELDERSAVKIYPYVKPNIIVGTNLYRDSIKRNAHTEYIVDIINSAIPKESKLILNGDDLICSSLGVEGNKKVFYGIDRIDSDIEESINIVRDIIACPRCNTKIKYEYVRYHHIGKAYCPNCDFKSPDIDYQITKIDIDNNCIKIKVNEEIEEYSLILGTSIINIYNQLTSITALREYGLSQEQINKSLVKTKIVKSRYNEEEINGVKIITHLAKGQNPVACSRIFDYVKNEPGKKIVILVLDDIHDAHNSSENITWIYDTDFELLDSDDIVQIISGGARYKDIYLRMLLSDISKEKITCIRDELDTAKYINTQNIDKIFILHDLYAVNIATRINNKIKEVLK